MSIPLAGLGAAFAIPAGAATAGIGWSIAGSVLGGIGSAMLQKAQYDREEKMEIDAENRRAGRYSGIGSAMRFDEGGEAEPAVAGQVTADTPLGAAHKTRARTVMPRTGFGVKTPNAAGAEMRAYDRARKPKI